MSESCHYGCKLGRRCMGDDRAVVIEWLVEQFKIELNWESDDELESRMNQLNDGEPMPGHIRRVK